VAYTIIGNRTNRKELLGLKERVNQDKRKVAESRKINGSTLHKAKSRYAKDTAFLWGKRKVW
jgi:hypothetical protein